MNVHKIELNLLNDWKHKKQLSKLLIETDSYIFGGAVRDSLNRDKIKDIDIITNSPDKLRKFFTKLGFKKSENSKDFVEYNNREKRFDLEDYSKDGLWFQLIILDQTIRANEFVMPLDYIAMVDLTCCAVGTQLNNIVLELSPTALHDIKLKRIVAIKNSYLMTEKRLKNRKVKFMLRGWNLTGKRVDRQTYECKAFLEGLAEYDILKNNLTR